MADRGVVPRAILAMIVVLALLLAPASALAARHQRPPKPRLAWTLPATASAGQPIGFTWTGSHLGKGHKLVVQKPEGTAHTWRSIMRLNGNSGSAQLPGVELGHYRYRIADLAPVPRPPRRSRRDWRPHFRVMAEEVSGVAVFGEVPFTTLFRVARPSVQTTPTTTFPYVASWGYPETPAFQVSNNHCSEVHVAFVTHGFQRRVDSGGVTTLSLVQESHDPVSASAAWDTIGSLDGEVIPGQTWAVNISIQKEDEEEGFETYINGYAICDSAEPFNA